MLKSIILLTLSFTTPSGGTGEMVFGFPDMEACEEFREEVQKEWKPTYVEKFTLSKCIKE